MSWNPYGSRYDRSVSPVSPIGRDRFDSASVRSRNSSVSSLGASTCRYWGYYDQEPTLRRGPERSERTILQSPTVESFAALRVEEPTCVARREPVAGLTAYTFYNAGRSRANSLVRTQEVRTPSASRTSFPSRYPTRSRHLALEAEAARRARERYLERSQPESSHRPRHAERFQPETKYMAYSPHYTDRPVPEATYYTRYTERSEPGMTHHPHHSQRSAPSQRYPPGLSQDIYRDDSRGFFDSYRR
ncbi:hypothetical protein BJ546DRAFT_236788 [Cryomyces antarcticus]